MGTADKTLKLKASLDVSEVGAAADKAVAKINSVKRAAESGGTSLKQAFNPRAGLATDPAAFFAAEEAKMAEQAIEKKSLPAAKKFSLEFKKSSSNVRDLGKAIRQLPNITEAMGIYGLRGITNLVAQIGPLMRGLGGIARAIGIGGGLVGLAAAGGAYGIAKVRQSVKIGNDSTSQTGANNSETIDRLRKRVAELAAAGGLRGPEGAGIQADLFNLDQRNSKNAKLKSDQVRGIGAANIAQELGELQGRLKAAITQGYAGEENAAGQHAAVLLQIRQEEIEAERAEIRRNLERITADQSLSEKRRAALSAQQFARLRGLGQEETEAQRQELDRQETALKAQLARETNDKEAAAETQAKLKTLAEQKRLLNLQGDNSQTDLNAEEDARNRDALNRAPRQRRTTDALQRIGLFRGGIADPVVSVAKQQLTTLKKIAENTKNAPAETAKALTR